MTDVMMALGSFKFSVETAAYNSFRRQVAYRWPSQERLGREAALQYTGPGEETISLSGFFYPSHTGRYGIVQDIRDLASQGRPQLLVDGTGIIWGYYAIERVEEGATQFLPNGIGRKIDFSLDLKYYGAKYGSKV